MTNGSLMKVESIAECFPWSILQYFVLHKATIGPVFLRVAILQGFTVLLPIYTICTMELQMHFSYGILEQADMFKKKIKCKMLLYFGVAIAGNAQNMKPVQFAQISYFAHFLRLYLPLEIQSLETVREGCSTLFVLMIYVTVNNFLVMS